MAHAGEALVFSVFIAVLWLGYRDHFRQEVSTSLVTLAAMAAGIAIGVVWELGEFSLDWVIKWDLQASNKDTMTDFLWIDLAAVAGALLASCLYCNTFSAALRRETGEAAAWLIGGPARLIDKHWRLVVAALALTIAGYVALLWFVDRSIPGFPTN
jgi:hypothetical protein